MTQGIYGIFCNVSSKWYVGQSFDIENRWSVRKWAFVKGNSHNSHLQAAFNKYGVVAFEFIVLEEVFDSLQLTEREEFWLSEKRKLGGVYNTREVADSCLGMKCSSKTRAKISASTKGRVRGTRSPESYAKTAAANKGKKRSSDARARMSAAQKARKRSSYFSEAKIRFFAAKRKVSTEQVAQILALRSAGYTYQRIGEVFGVSYTTSRDVCLRLGRFKIVSGKSYADVE
jgi:group I intron endonuclease